MRAHSLAPKDTIKSLAAFYTIKIFEMEMFNYGYGFFQRIPDEG